MNDAAGALDISVGRGGWLRVYDESTGLRAFVRFDRDSDGRLYPGAMLTQAHDADGRVRSLRGADLREFPLAAVDAAANGDLRDQILSKIDSKVTVQFVNAEGAQTDEPDWARRSAKRPSAQDPADLSIDVPDTRTYPDEFYAAVAAAYMQVAPSSSRPAALIAEANDVPVKTVHRWIAEARKRGHLAPGRKGRVG